MTILRTNNYSVNYPTIVEDPTPGADLIFFQNDAYRSSTLASIFNTTISYNVAGSGYSNWGTSNYQTSTDPWYWQGTLILNGEVTHCKHLSVAVDNYRNNLDYSPWLSMDLNNKIEPIQYYTDGTSNNLVQAFYNSQGTTAANNYVRFFRRQNTTNNLSVGYPSYNADALGAIATGYTAYPLYRNPVTNNIICIGVYNATGYHPGGYAGLSINAAFTVANPPTIQNVTAVANVSCQFVGVSSVNGQALMLHNSVAHDYTQTIYRYNDATNLSPSVNSYTFAPAVLSTTSLVGSYLISNYHNTPTASITVTGTSPSASVTGYIIGNVLNVTAATAPNYMQVGQTISGTGVIAGTTITATGTNVTTSVGGVRTNAYLPKIASSTFVDLSTSTTYGFYLPYFDTAGTYQPFYYQWNTTNDNFVRNQDIKVIYGNGTANTSTFLSLWAPETVSSTSVTRNDGMQRAWYNESFIFNNARYLTFMQFHGAGTVMDANTLQRTFMTYTVNTATYKTLTYHSSVTIPTTPKNIVWLNDARTLLGVFGHSAFWIYNFTSAGWTLTQTQPYQFSAVGRDSQGRIWGVDAGPLGGGRIHLITTDIVPATISLVPSSSVFNYTGTNQLFTFALDALSSTGTRIAVNVTLTVTGNSLRILDGASNQYVSYTTATSTSTSVIVNAAIIAAGPSSIATTIAL